MGKIIVIDPGHCDKFSGACNGNRREQDDNLRMALAVEKILISFGHTVYLTRRDGSAVNPASANDDLNARPLYANKMKADYFISLHRNSASPSATGIETWIYSKANPTTTFIAQAILNEVMGVANVSNRGVNKGYTGEPNSNYAVNRLSNMPSCLLELLFLSNNEDNKIYDDNFDKYAQAIAVGICKGLGVNYEPIKPVDPPKSDNLYRVQLGAFSIKSYAENMLSKIKAAGLPGYIKYYDDTKMYHVQVGAYVDKGNANEMISRLKKLGFSAFIKRD